MKRTASAESRSLRQLTLVLILLSNLFALIPLAHASPPDPSWIEGLYDAADYDDVVVLATCLDSTVDLVPPVGVSPIPIVLGLVPSVVLADLAATPIPAFQIRAPPNR